MEINDIKNHLSITEVLHHYNLRPNKNNMLNCPFHEDKTPSFQVYPQTNTWCCFSSNCKAGTGDQIQFIELYEKLNKHEAILKAQSFIAITPTPGLNKTMLLTKIFTFFSSGLKLTKAAVNYMALRNITGIEAGFNGGRFHYRMELSQQETGYCIQLGLITSIDSENPNSRTTYRNWGKDCIVFALKNKQNQTVSFYGRSIINNDNERHFYMKNREGLYPCYPGSETEKLILTESVIDAATLLLIPEIKKQFTVLALYGTNGMTSEHTEAVRQLKQLKEVILFFDGDQAGLRAIEKYSKELKVLNSSLTVSKVNTPENEDINSLLQGHEKEVLINLIEQRELIFSIENKNIISTEKKTESVQILPAEEPGKKFNTENPHQIVYENNWLTATVWGGIEKENLSRLKVSLNVELKSNPYRNYRNDVNLYNYSQVRHAVQDIAAELETSTGTIKQSLHDLTRELETYRLVQLEKEQESVKPKKIELSKEQEEQAKQFLTAPSLIRRTLETISKTGLIGEQKNGLLLYCLYLSRFFDEPLHAIIFGKSGSGKTYLQTKISECLPEESLRSTTSLSENTLYYSPKGFWKNTVLLIEDLEGVYSALLPLREFMSKQSITKLTTDKDNKGNNVQKVLTVEGPICVSGATTKESIYEDNANRSFLLYVDESPQHLEEVMQYQRKAQAGLINKGEQQQAKELLKHTQRLLRKVNVINPYGPELHIPESVFKKLRTNMHYLKLIEIITFYNQHQRAWKKDESGQYYIESTLEDIAWANYLVKDTLLSKSDELNGTLRQFFEGLKKIMQNKKEAGFYAKGIREILRMNPMRVNRYLNELEMRGYLKRTGGNRKTGFEYEIAAWEEYRQLQEGINVLDKVLETLKAKHQAKKSASLTV
jgi:DNA primase